MFPRGRWCSAEVASCMARNDRPPKRAFDLTLCQESLLRFAIAKVTDDAARRRGETKKNARKKYESSETEKRIKIKYIWFLMRRPRTTPPRITPSPRYPEGFAEKRKNEKSYLSLENHSSTSFCSYSPPSLIFPRFR